MLERFTAPDRAANIPEFVDIEPTAIRQIREQFLDDYSFVRAANAFFKAGDVDNAIPQYRKALEMNPNNAEAHNNLAFLLLNVKGLSEEGMEHARAAVRLSPENPRAHFNIGVALLHQKDCEGAISYLSEALRRMPVDLEGQYKLVFLHFHLGMACFRAGKMPEAAEHLSKAVTLDPAKAEYRLVLGQALVAGKKPGEAIAQLTEAVRLEPENKTCRVALANALLDQKKIPEGVAQLSEALRLDPSNAGLHFMLANALLSQARPQDAVAHVREASRLDPRNAQYHYVLAQVSAAAGDLPEALTRYTTAVSLDPAIDTNADLHDNLAMNYAQAGQFRDAVREAEKALSLAQTAGKADLAAAIRGRLELYRQNKPVK